MYCNILVLQGRRVSDHPGGSVVVAAAVLVEVIVVIGSTVVLIVVQSCFREISILFLMFFVGFTPCRESAATLIVP